MSLTSVDADLELLGRAPLDLFGLAPAAADGLGKDALALLDADMGADVAGSVEDFDVNFLSDFLMADGPTLPEPESPPAGPLLAESRANAAMVVGAVPALEFVFDAARVPRKASGASSPSGSTTSASSDHSSGHQHLEAGPAAEPKDDESPEERKARRRAQVAISARRHRTRKKNEMMELRKQVNALNNHLDFLRSKHKMMRRDGAVAEWEERAMAQRHKRRQAEELNEQLKLALFSQRGFVKDLKNVFSSSPMHSTELNMRYLLHTYTRLGKNPHSRFRDFQSICTNSKLDLAMQIVTRETEGVNFDTPSITTRQIQAESNEFGMTTVAVYAFNTPDINKIFVAACSAILSCGSDWPNYTLMSAQAKVVDSPAAHIRYGVSNARYTNDTTREEILIEGRGTSYYRITDKYAVLLWDFVDVDDLYPVKEETHMKRDVIGAVVVRQEMCEDGVERVVCRNICTKVHALCKPSTSQNIKFFSQHTLSGAKACGCRVYEQIKDNSKRQVSM